jgi:hypothetical protein
MGGGSQYARVAVRKDLTQFTATSETALDHVNRYENLVVAMDRAVAWLRQKALGS